MTKAKEEKTENIEEAKVQLTEEIKKPVQPYPAFGRTISDIEADLKKPIPNALIKTRKQGGTEIRYISWYNAVKIMNYYAAGWSSEIKNIQSLGGKLIVTVRVTIPTIDGIVYREATGQENEDAVKFGDSTSNAESMALRRAFAKFGLALGLYEK